MLFTKCFLEPTHIAIAQIISGLDRISFLIVAKTFNKMPCFNFKNVTHQILYEKKEEIHRYMLSCDAVQAIYDGQIAFDAFQLAKRYKKPFILSFHGGFDTNAKIHRQSLKAITQSIAENADLVTVVTKLDVFRLKNIGISRYIEVIPVPIDYSIIPQKQKIDTQSIIAIGRLIPKKGFDTAILALKYLPETMTLTIIGTGPELNYLRDVVYENRLHKRVEFTGFLPLPNMLERLSRAAILVHPAQVAEDGNAEGIPQVVIWAQAMGIPVICGDSGSLRDAIIDGCNSHLVPPKDPEMMANKIMEVINKVSQIGILKTAQSQIFARHNLTSVVGTWETMYNSVKANAKIKSNILDPLEIILQKRPKAFNQALAAALSIAQFNNGKLELMESGGQGVIFLITNPNSVPAILKVANIFSEKKSDISQAVYRIKREGDILFELCKRGCTEVPKLYFLDSEGRFLVREYFDGVTLQEAAPRFSPTEIAVLLPKLISFCEALSNIFHRNLPGPYVIRDFKPKNIVVVNSSEIQYKLIDVGSVRPAGHRPKSPQSKIRLGSRNWLYWAPELLQSKGTYSDDRSDYFSFGATAFYLLAGHSPFSNSEPDESLYLDKYMKEYESLMRELEILCYDLDLPHHLILRIYNWLHPLPSHRKIDNG